MCHNGEGGGAGKADQQQREDHGEMGTDSLEMSSKKLNPAIFVDSISLTQVN